MKPNKNQQFDFDIVILTDSRYVAPTNLSDYVQNVLQEDELIKTALEKLEFRVWRTNWDNPTFDWTSTKSVLFRTTWDYFNRFDEFFDWLSITSKKTKMMNSFELIQWNIDKYYLGELEEKGIRIVPTHYILPSETTTLSKEIAKTKWDNLILKPAIAGTARHTYKINPNNILEHEAIFKSLIANETMLLQPFLKNVLHKGEIALMLFGGKFSHAVLKKAKEGDFRVQDDFGGSVFDYEASKEEIEFAEKVIAACPIMPIYARVDLLWNDDGELCVSEVECIEPELWMRKCDSAADKFALAVKERF